MINGRGFKIQKTLPEKHGSLKKKRKLLGGLVNRYFKVGWDGDHAVLLYSNDENLSGHLKKLSLARCSFICTWSTRLDRRTLEQI
jgi:hypothetical protein